jgi:hypothetical protein
LFDRVDRPSGARDGRTVGAPAVTATIVIAILDVVCDAKSGTGRGTVHEPLVMTESGLPGFEVFTQRSVPFGRRPYVTIQRRGTLALNDAAFDALGQPEAVELLYDAGRRIVGLNPVEPTVEHAYPVRSAGANTYTRVIAGTAFTTHFGIPTEVSRRWPARLDDGVLCIDLRTDGTEVTSNRTVRSLHPSAPRSSALV